MLVYCAHLPLVGTTPIQDVVAAIGEWLSSKTNRSVDSESLLQTHRQDLGSREFIESAILSRTNGTTLAIRYGHRDRQNKGREWLTDISVLQASGGLECSVLLHTRESSAKAFVPVQTTRPRVVDTILNRCKLNSNACGGRVLELTESDVQAFESIARETDRTYPIVQISSRPDGTFCPDPKDLSRILVGVADVVIIPPSVDTFSLAKMLGAHMCPYNGAVNILWPPVRSDGELIVPSSRLLAVDIEEMGRVGKTPIGELLGLVCSRTNAPYARRHTSVESVHTATLRVSLEHAQRFASEESKELNELIRQVDADQRDEIARYKAELASVEGEFSALASRFDEERAANETLKHQLTELSSKAPTVQSASLTEAERRILATAVTGLTDLEHALQVIQILYTDRVVVLQSAWESAKDSKKFIYVNEAFVLLQKLVNEFYLLMLNGKGDLEARTVFGTAYAARESESVENNKRATALRVFTFGGKQVQMMRHLKIGTKPSKHETFRCHFHWDSQSRRVVIGHCGQHLDHK